MKRASVSRRVAIAAAIAIPVALLTSTAHADVAPTSTDVVGVGSDVVQYTVDFGADGDTSGDPGFNATLNTNRLVNFDATADGNGRNAYVSGTTTTLNPTIVLREGSSPVQRPNGGGAGLNALINDGSNGKSANKISFARTPNLPTGAQQTLASSNLGSRLHVVQIATDSQVIAVANTTNAPTGLSVDELLAIYTGQDKTWGDVPGYTGSAKDQTIVPLIPQVGAGVRTTFLNALKAANGGTAPNLSGSVRNVEQNDPSTITTLSSTDQPNAILPFPTGRLALYDSHYFLNPATAYNSASPAAPIDAGVKLLSATAGDGEASYNTTLPYYIVFRQADAISPTPWQPGGTLNWVQTLFSDPSGPAPFFNTNAGKALINASGAKAAYNDLGVVSAN